MKQSLLKLSQAFFTIKISTVTSKHLPFWEYSLDSGHNKNHDKVHIHYNYANLCAYIMYNMYIHHVQYVQSYITYNMHIHYVQYAQKLCTTTNCTSSLRSTSSDPVSKYCSSCSSPDSSWPNFLPSTTQNRLKNEQSYHNPNHEMPLFITNQRQQALLLFLLGIWGRRLLNGQWKWTSLFLSSVCLWGKEKLMLINHL